MRGRSAPALPVSHRVTLIYSVPLLAQLLARHSCAVEIGRDLVPFHVISEFRSRQIFIAHQ